MNDKKITNVGVYKVHFYFLKYKFTPTEKFTFPPNVNLIDLGKISITELQEFTKNSFPLIIKMVIKLYLCLKGKSTSILTINYHAFKLY